MKARMLEEHPTHFVMHDGKSPFRVARFGLSPELEEKIRGMADGGKVRRLTGKAVDSTEDEESGGDAPEPTMLDRVTEFARGLGTSVSGGVRRPEVARRAPAPRPKASGPSRPSDTPLDHPEDLSVQRAHGGAIPGYADGGAAEQYNPYDPSMLEPRRESPRVVFVSPEPSPGSVPVDTGAGGGRPDTGAGGGPGWYGPGTVSRRDMGSGGAEGGASGNQTPPAEAVAMRQNAPTSAPLTRLSANIVRRGEEPPAAPQPTREPKRAVYGGSPEVMGMKDYEAGAAEEQRLLGEQGRLEAERARSEGVAAEERAKVHAKYARDEQDTRARAQLAQTEMLAKSQALMDNMKRIDTTVDPGRYWASKSTGDKVLAAIGIALGSFSNDGVNRAAQMLGQAIDRDIDAQKTEHTLRLQKGEKALQGLQTMYAMQHQVFGDELAATAAAKTSALEVAADQAEAQAAKYNSPAAQQKLQMLAAQLRKAGATQKADLVDKSASAGLKKAETSKAYAEAERDRTAGPKAPPEALVKVTAAAKDAMGLINSLETTLASTQSGIPGGTAINQNFGTAAGMLDTDTSQLVAKLKDINQLGAMSKDDHDLLTETIGDPKAVFTREGTKRAKLERVKRIIADTVANERAARGLQ